MGFRCRCHWHCSCMIYRPLTVTEAASTETIKNVTPASCAALTRQGAPRRIPQSTGTPIKPPTAKPWVNSPCRSLDVFRIGGNLINASTSKDAKSSKHLGNVDDLRHHHGGENWPARPTNTAPQRQRLVSTNFCPIGAIVTAKGRGDARPP